MFKIMVCEYVQLPGTVLSRGQGVYCAEGLCNASRKTVYDTVSFFVALLHFLLKG